MATTSNPTRLFIIEKISVVNEIKPTPDDMVCLIVPDVKYIYKTLDRLNTRTIVIGNETFSDTVSIKLYQKNMSKYRLRHMTLIGKSQFVENDIAAVIGKLNPDDVIRIK